MNILVLYVLLIVYVQTSSTSYLYQYHRKNNMADAIPTGHSIEESEEDKHAPNCRHVKLNIHIGQFVINETIVDNQSQAEPMGLDSQHYYSSHTGGKSKYKKQYKKLKLPSFKYMNKTTTSINTYPRFPLAISKGPQDGKQAKDSIKMINDIVKDIVKKYKTKFNVPKLSRDGDVNQCICQFQDSPVVPDISLLDAKLGLVMTTPSSVYEADRLSSEDKDKMKQVIIDKVIALLNASKCTPGRDVKAIV